ncbi:uncharacterized protein LOC142760567 [Rhinoderma darwinii]|uniref:uncharacterized protein LOC142760567 n=1 Tax=Rhinoderma darwinii TaxID=43563 RepID=UPI003F67B330
MAEVYRNKRKDELLVLCEERRLDGTNKSKVDLILALVADDTQLHHSEGTEQETSASEERTGDSSQELAGHGSTSSTRSQNGMESSLSLILQQIGNCDPNMRMQLVMQERQAEREAAQRKAEREAAQRQAEFAERQAEREYAERQAEREYQLKLTQMQLPSASSSPQGEPTDTVNLKPRLERFPVMEKDGDLDVYLKGFEKVCRQFQLPPADWAKYLTPGLKGKALEVFAALPTTIDQDYEAIKKALIQRFNLTPEVYRKRYRALQRTGTDSYSDLADGLKNHFRQWTQGLAVNTFEDLEDLMILDQFLHTCPMEVRQFILDREPKTLDKAAQIADVYAANRAPEARKPAVPGWKGGKPPINTFAPTRRSPGGVAPAPLPRPAVDNRRCFGCNQVGHISTACPEKRKTTPLPKPSILSPAVLFVGGRERASCDNLQAVTVGKTVTMGLRDTGAEMTLVHPELVSSEDIIPGKTLTVSGVGGLIPALPMARVYLDWGAGRGMMDVGVTDKIPTNVLLGTDLGRLVSRYISSDHEEDSSVLAAPCVSPQRENKKEPGTEPWGTRLRDKVNGKESRVRKRATERAVREILGNPRKDIVL